MATQHTWLLAILALLTVVLQATEAGPYAANVEDSTCCQSYARRPLPHSALKDFYWTSLNCRRPGVVLLTIRDLEICADPRQAWVKRILRKLNKGGRTF